MSDEQDKIEKRFASAVKKAKFNAFIAAFAWVFFAFLIGSFREVFDIIEGNKHIEHLYIHFFKDGHVYFIFILILVDIFIDAALLREKKSVRNLLDNGNAAIISIAIFAPILFVVLVYVAGRGAWLLHSMFLEFMFWYALAVLLFIRYLSFCRVFKRSVI